MKEHEEKHSDAGLVENLRGIMKRQYQDMRQKAGIQEVLDNSDGSDYETEQAFKILRPNVKHKLMDLLTGKVKQPKKQLYRRPERTKDELSVFNRNRYNK